MNKKSDTGLILAITLAALAILMLFFPYSHINGTQVGNYRLEITEYDKLATFISGITAPFLSLSAFLLLYLTYKSQKKELEETRKVLNSQTDTQKLQRFEMTFFNLIDLHNKIVNNLSIELTETHTDVWAGKHWTTKDIKVGRNSLDILFKEFKINYYGKISPNDDAALQDAAKCFFEKYSYKLSIYFDNLHNVFNFLDDADVAKKSFYTSLFVAQLSKHELLLLFYHQLADKWPSAYIETFHVFRQLNSDYLLSKHHKSFYQSSAY